MRKYKNEILILAFTGILIIGFGAWHTVEAVDSSIYVSPAQLNKKIGDTFDILVKISPKGQKVCVVEGKMSLTKLSCQKVTMGSDISVQSSPSCNDLSFLIGIQGCVTQDKTLFTVTVKAKSSGTATANFSSVDIIGEGVSISSAFSKGIYTLTALEEKAVSGLEEKIVSEKEITPENKIASEEIASEEIVAEEHEEEILPEKNEEETSEEEVIVSKGLLAAIGIMPFNWKLVLIIIGIIVAVLIVLQLVRKRRNRRLSE